MPEKLPKSFRLTKKDVATLKKITRAVNKESQTKISETKVIQALIYIAGTEMKPNEILDAVRELV